MPLVAAEAPDEKPFAIVRASDIEKTGSQVAVLCQIIDTVLPFLRNAPDTGTTVELAKGAEDEAMKTFELANIKLRDIIDDPRWDLKPTDAEKASQATLEANTVKNLSSAKLVDAMAAPHKLCNANIRLFPSVGWVAWVGDGMPTHHHLHGVGQSPAQAFAAFDRNYSQIVAIAKSIPPQVTPQANPAKNPAKPAGSRRKPKK